MKLCILAEIPEKYKDFFPKDRGSDDKSMPHITLLYVGTFNEKHLNDIVDCVDKIIKDLKPIECEFGELDSFPVGDHGTPYFVKINSNNKLNELHNKIKNKIKDLGIPLEERWKDYKAHATLKYMPGNEKYIDKVPVGKFTIDKLTCSIWNIDDKDNI